METIQSDKVKTSENIKIKATELLESHESSLLRNIIHKCKYFVEHRETLEKDSPEAFFELVELISDPSKWEYHGLYDDDDVKIMDVLKYLLNDNAEKIRWTK